MNYPENIEEIEKFAEEINLDVKYLLGEKYEGELNLYSVQYLPNNIQFNIDGFLILYFVKVLPDNIQFNIGGDLYFCYVESLSPGTVFNVGGKLYLQTDHKVKVLWD